MKSTHCLTGNRFSVLACNDKVDTAPNTLIEPSPPVLDPLLTLEGSSVVDSLSPPDRILIRSGELRRSTYLDLQLQTLSGGTLLSQRALLDSGATGLFIDEKFVRARKWKMTPMPRAIPVYNIDGTLNTHGSVRHTVELIVRYQQHTERATFYVTDLGGTSVIIGHPWLVEHNPEVDWVTGKVVMLRCPDGCNVRAAKTENNRRRKVRAAKVKARRIPTIKDAMTEEGDVEMKDSMLADLGMGDGDRILCVSLQSKSQDVRATSTVSQRLAEADEKMRVKKSFEEMVPGAYHEFKKVFLKESFDTLPACCKWDHAIDLTPGSEPWSSYILCRLKSRVNWIASWTRTLRQVAFAHPGVLHQEEGRFAALYPGLSQAQCDDCEKRVSASARP